MKKVIIVLLLLVPLIVLFTISASGMIISAEVSIGIESFELWHKGEHVTQVTINLSEYRRKNLKYQLIPRYFPGVAQVSGFKWVSDTPSVATVDKDGIVTFHDCGFAKITAISVDSSSVRASCAFFVEDDVIHALDLSSYETQQAITRFNLSIYEKVQPRLTITPYSALVGDPRYSSSDESVFTCTQNGVITAIGEGSATLTVEANSKSGDKKEIKVPVVVSGTALVKRQKVCVYGSGNLDLTPYLTAGSIVGGNLIDLSTIPEGESASFVVRQGGQESRITVERLSYEKTVGIEDYEVLLSNEWQDGVFIASGRTLTLQPIDRITLARPDNAMILSSDSSILAVENSTIKAVGVGKATLTFRAEGYQEFSMEMTVARPITYFALNFDVDNDVVGLGSERVYGVKSIYDGQIKEGIQVTPEQIYPAEGSKNLFYYRVEEDYASVDEDGFVTLREDAVGKSVTVTVGSYLSTNGITRSYTFRNLVKGINVGFGYGANACDPDKGIMPAYAPYYDAVKTMYEDRSYALVFQTNLYMPTREEVEAIEGKYQKLCFIRDIYGNGYKIDGQFYQYEFESRVFEEGDDSQLEGYPDQKGVTITDLFVNSYAPVGGDSKTTFAELMELGGTPIRTYYKERPDFTVAFKYCVFQYSYTHVIAIGGTVSFDGCIFRNSAGVAILIESLHEQETDASIHNCIFSNSISATGLLSNGTLPVPKGEEVHYNTLRWTGNNYIYNWKKLSELRLDIIPKGVMKDETLDTILDSVNNKLSECARKSFDGKANHELVVTHEMEKYVNMGIICMGYWAPVNPIINRERENLTDGLKLEIDLDKATFTELKLNTVPLGSIKTLASSILDFDAPTYLLTNKGKDGSFNTSPEETYKLDESTYAKLRG